mmetsp:Transcript_7525/g.15720  ORF Transcript_7525/g.15720 Transcript_7525/m.15720 type:complete len:525 (+) Transcript_7525:153-1727(+)
MRSFPSAGAAVSGSKRSTKSRGYTSSSSLPAVNVLILLLSGCLLITSIFVLLLAINIPSLESSASDASSSGGHGHLRSSTSESSEVTLAGQEQNQAPNRSPNKRNYLHRFPLYGTAEFKQLCSWAFQDAQAAAEAAALPTKPDCYMLSRPSPTSSEGISEWLTNVAIGKIYAVQFECLHILDYGPGIDIHSVLTYADDDNGSTYNNWTVPDDILAGGCDKQHSCFRVSAGWSQRMLKVLSRDIARIKRNSGHHVPPKAVPVPNYRWVYHSTHRDKTLADYPALLEAGRDTGNSNLLGFDAATGMACALGSTLKLAPSAANYIPRVHSDILPALRDDSALVIALYIRTGRTDQLLRKKLADSTADKTQLVGYSQHIVSCALELERDHLSKGKFARSVWFVATDSPNIGRAVVSLYDGVSVEIAQEEKPQKVFQRRVYTTASRGVQTKAQISPKTADFAEALIDWYLLAESNFVVSLGSYTFAHTAALRTGRPIYTPHYKDRKGTCHVMELPFMENVTALSPVYEW